MKEFSHFYSRYGQALLYEEISENYIDKAKELLELGLERFRLKAGAFEGEEQTTYSYARIKKGNPNKGIFLAPSVTITDIKATGLWSQVQGLMKQLENSQLSDNASVKQSIAPMTGEYNNGRSRHTPKSTLEEAVCCAIATTSTIKPCISFRGSDGKYTNYSIIPDLPVQELQTFIALFRRMLISNATRSLFVGSVSKVEKTSGAKYTPRRPELFYGNFPNPPRSSYLATIGVIASIAEWAKEAKLTTWANEVLESLKGATLYMVTYGDAKPFTYNHYVVDLAKEGKLREIIDSVFHTQLFEKSRWNYSSKEDQIEYKKFDLFASRFLQLFNRPAFKDFLAFRAEYPNALEILFITYFTKMERINIEIVQSAKQLGRWLNYVAYITAKAEHPNTKSEEFRKTKAKVLVEIESSAFSAKSGDALIAQVVTRAGRLSQIDAPPEADIFIEQTCSGELPLDNAKNLLMAFSRLRNKYEKPVQSEDEKETEENESIDTSEYTE
jgi:CRISPR-associated protein Cas8c/Csp2